MKKFLVLTAMLGFLVLATLSFLAIPHSQAASRGKKTDGAIRRSSWNPGLTLAIQTAQQGGNQRAPLQKNLSLLGFTDLGRPANGTLTSDVWAHGNFAYVGTFIDFTGTNVGVQVIDISDPTNPQLVNQLPTPEPFTGANDIKVARIDTQSFRGDLLVVTNEARFDEATGTFKGARGIQIWDVTNPLSPVELSRLSLDPNSLVIGPYGVHNTFLYQKGNRAFVLLAVLFAEVFSNFATGTTRGDLMIVEVTDPTTPVIISDWGIGKDAGLAFGALFFPGAPFFAGVPGAAPGSDCTPPPGTPNLCRGNDFPGVFLHDVWANTQGTVAYLSYWDAGLILLDISDPANPTLIGQGVEPATDEGNLHAAVPAQGGNLVVVGDEDVTPLPWGFLRIFDTSDPTNPTEISTFATDGALNDSLNLSSMHNIFVRGSRAYLSWYFEGIRVVDLSQPSNPREIASFIADPNQTSPGLFWGIYVHQDLILASDILGGLFILKQEASGLNAPPHPSSLAADSLLEVSRLKNAVPTGVLPKVTGLDVAYPNPSNPEVWIPYRLSSDSAVEIRIYDVQGDLVRMLDLGHQSVGYYHTKAKAAYWDGRNTQGETVPSGVYFYTFKAGDFTATRKLSITR